MINNSPGVLSNNNINSDGLFFCTLFNSAYLSRGLALYQSLIDHCPKVHLFIFAFDEECYLFLKALELKKATIISLGEFEDEQLLTVKSSRTAGEYCWTCTPTTILFCLQKYNLDHCTYLDADLLFFKDPRVLLDEMGENSVLITEHRFSPEHDQSANGKYCVQFVCFKNDTNGLKVLNWWRNACIDWCYNRVENGKFGDQKYLDCWTIDFEGVHELQHLGGGVAPWNVQQYEFNNKEQAIQGVELKTGKTFELVFYHFHDFKYVLNNTVRLTAEHYFLPESAVSLIYRPYLKYLRNAEELIEETDCSQKYNEKKLDLAWLNRSLMRRVRFLLQGYYKNYYRRALLNS
ncbi:glycosyl transferase [Desertivirga arenae]|uniref:glycosyl transferase n=1 Tax=Desertivirga arenae TaxID=2810309 RepID=UPI001F6257F1|nr:glycosyl transferase [Pedobacter sp. SYSU D00823]